jgi:hypothetical protein
MEVETARCFSDSSSTSGNVTLNPYATSSRAISQCVTQQNNESGEQKTLDAIHSTVSKIKLVQWNRLAIILSHTIVDR